eukprot:4574784-Pyramimonas_sp.AAC.1
MCIHAYIHTTYAYVAGCCLACASSNRSPETFERNVEAGGRVRCQMRLNRRGANWPRAREFLSRPSS